MSSFIFILRGTMDNTVSIVGLGYVGLPLAILADQKQYQVFGIDNDMKKIEALNKKESPFFDEKISEDLKTSNILASDDFEKVKESSIIIICVPTPVSEDFIPNLDPVKNACKAVAPYLQKGQLIVLESTVNPGVSEDIVLPILEEISGLKCGTDFSLAHCPERINPGDKKWNVENISRVVGATDEIGLKKAAEFYRSIISGQVKEMNTIKEAEAVKVVENSFRDINIAFVNELAMSFDSLGIDVVNVIDGAATKPFAFMAHYPGCGVGGHCIPVDPYYLIEYARKHGFQHDFLSMARKVNNKMPKYTALKVSDGLNQKRIAINGTKVAVLGLSYKSDIGDDRESPSYKIIKHLNKYGAEVVSFDPYVLNKSTVQTLEEALVGAKALVIATCHKEFKNLTPGYLESLGIEVAVDGRNCLKKTQFQDSNILYMGIGR